MGEKSQRDLEFEAIKKWIWLMPAGWIIISAVIISLTFVVDDPEYTREAPAKIAATAIWLVGVWALVRGRQAIEDHQEQTGSRPPPRELRVRHGIATLIVPVGFVAIAGGLFWSARTEEASPWLMAMLLSLMMVGVPGLMVLRAYVVTASTPTEGRRYSVEVARRARRVYIALTLGLCGAAAIAVLLLPGTSVLVGLAMGVAGIWLHYLSSEHSEPA